MTELQVRGRVVLPERVLPAASLTITGDRIAAVEKLPAGAGVPDLTVLPGLVDVHCHGAAGGAFTELGADGVQTAARHHLEHGTTTLVGSLVTAPPDELLALTRQLADATAAGVLAGIHLEGPFLAPSRRGAHDETRLLAPDPRLLDALLVAGAGHVRQVTLAPELPGGLAMIEQLTAQGVIAAVGHSDADFATAAAAFAAGARQATHLFNGMSGWQHRRAGVVPAALAAAARGQAIVELIADGVHVDAGTVAAVHALLGPDRMIFVSDAMAAAGFPDGEYALGPMRVIVRAGVARIDDGTGHGSIAGSTARLLDLVRFAHLQAGLPLADAVRSASLTPAGVLGLAGDRGALRPGLRADLVLVDADLQPVAVMRAGQWVHGEAG